MEKNIRSCDPEENAETKEYSNIKTHLVMSILRTYIEAAYSFPTKLGLIAKRVDKKERVVNEFLRSSRRVEKRGADTLQRSCLTEREKERQTGKGKREKEARNGLHGREGGIEERRR